MKENGGGVILYAQWADERLQNDKRRVRQDPVKLMRTFGWASSGTKHIKKKGEESDGLWKRNENSDTVVFYFSFRLCFFIRFRSSVTSYIQPIPVANKNYFRGRRINITYHDIKKRWNEPAFHLMGKEKNKISRNSSSSSCVDVLDSKVCER